MNKKPDVVVQGPTLPEISEANANLNSFIDNCSRCFGLSCQESQKIIVRYHASLKGQSLILLPILKSLN